MGNSRVALRYAKAILDLAVDQKGTEKVEKDMRSIVGAISENNDLKDMLGSPIIPGATKKEVLAQVFKGSHAITEGVLNILVDNKRIAELNEVALKYIILHEQMKGKGVAYVTTAVPMDEAMEKKVLKQVATISGNQVTIENKVDAAILGGFILRVGDLQYDASISNKLNNLKREFTNSL